MNVWTPGCGLTLNRGHPAARGLYAFWPTRAPFTRAGIKSVDVCGNENLTWNQSSGIPRLTPNYHGYAGAGTGKGRGPQHFSVYFTGSPTRLVKTGFRYPQTEASMFAWVNQTNANGQMIMGNIDNLLGYTAAYRMYIQGGTFRVELTLGVNIEYDSGFAATNNGWHWLGFTYDGANVRTYADGKLKTTTARTGPIAPNNGIFYWGHNDYWGDNFNNGYIADGMVYQAALNQAECWELYNQALTGFPGILVPQRGPLDYSVIAAAAPDVPYNPWDTQAVRSRAAQRRNTAYLTAGTVLGDVVRPDATDPLPEGRPVWHTPLALPDTVSRARAARLAAVRAQGSRGDVERPDAFDPLPTYQSPPLYARVLVYRRRPYVEGYSTDVSHLGDPPVVYQPAFDVALTRVLPRRQPPPFLPGTAILDPSLIPEDPFNAPSLMWHVSLALPVLPVKARGPRPLYPWLALQLVPELTFEAPEIKFHTALALPRILRVRHLPPGLSLGGIDLDAAQRAEVTFPAAFTLTLALPPYRKRRYHELARGSLGLEPQLLIERVHPEVLLRQEVYIPRRVLPLALTALEDAAELNQAGFEIPFTVLMRKWMLAAGLWRGRL